MIESLKDLKSLFKLCRQNGVSEIKLNGVEFKMNDLPVSTNPDIEEMEDAEEEFMKAVEAPFTTEEAVAFAAGA